MRAGGWEEKQNFKMGGGDKKGFSPTIKGGGREKI
jgi:hypothetical protein